MAEEDLTATDTDTLEEGGVSDDAATAVNLLDMSDDEFTKALMEDFVGEPKDDSTDESKETDSASDEDDTEKKTPDDPSEDQDSKKEEDFSDTSEEENLLASLDQDKIKDESEDERKVRLEAETDTEEGDDDEEDSDSEEEEDSKEEKKLSPEDTVKEIFAPFRANGKDMKVQSVDDIRQLMQMGANYNKKMAALKPNLRLMKMLQNNNLLDESKLSFLIDLDKKNPDAIKKLIKDAEIDPDDLDKDDEINYKPSTYTVNDREIELDATLDDIRDTKSFATTLDVIGNKWDEASRSAILENPAAIRVLNDHVSDGVFDRITAAVENERMFNRIPIGMSDLEAYKHVGDMINSQGGFKEPKSGNSVTKTVVKADKKAVDSTASKRKKAASSTTSSPKKNSKETFNPLAMSDEDFENTSMDKFI